MPVICPHCSHTNLDQAMFCAHCGRQLRPGNQVKETPQGTSLPVLTASVPSPSTSVTTPEPYSGRSEATPFTPGLASETYGSHARRLKQGTQLSEGRYSIEKLVAAGGMGAVYRAIDQRFMRPCAIKEMLDNFMYEGERAQAAEWFKREATLLLDLNHPSIPRVRDFFIEGGKYYLVMDFIEGQTLGDIWAKEGNVIGLNGARGVPEVRARVWAQQICSVLAYLHSQKPPVIFRDLKPSNMMVTDQEEIKLIDFGIARSVQSQRQSTIIMTVGYAPPEQLHGMPEPRSDLYALGATLHRVLTHHDAGNNRPSIFSFPPIRSLRPDVSPDFEQVVMKALAPHLDQRWGSALEMESAIIKLPPVTVTPPVVSISELDRQRQPELPLTPGTAPPTFGTTGPAALVPEIDTGPDSDIESGPIGLPFRRTAANPFIRIAQDHLAAGRIEPAFDSIRQAHGVEPNNALVHKIFGQVFACRQPPSPDLAIQAYNRSLQLNPNDAETHKLLGDVYLNLHKQPAQAIEPYAQSLRLNPNNFETHHRLGRCYEETNQLEVALREYQEAIYKLPPDLKRPDLHSALGQLAFRNNQLSMAERAFVQVLTLNPEDHSTRFLLSQVYEREGKFHDALRECSYVFHAMPDNKNAQIMMHHLQNRSGRKRTINLPNPLGRKRTIDLPNPYLDLSNPYLPTSEMTSSKPPPSIPAINLPNPYLDLSNPYLPMAEMTSSKPLPSIPAIESISSETFSPNSIARVLLEEEDVAIVGKTYRVEAGISERGLEEGRGMSMTFDVVLHTSQNIKLKTQWHKRLTYDPLNLYSQLIEFTFQAAAPGHSSLFLDFYQSRRWLRTMRFEFRAIKKP